MKILRYVSVFAIGIIFTLLLPDKEKKNIQAENRNLKAIIKSLKKNELADGGLTILPKNTRSIMLSGFTGTIEWYQSPNFENLLNGNPTDFHPIGDTIQIYGGEQIINVPKETHAILRKSTGEAYRMKVNTHSNF